MYSSISLVLTVTQKYCFRLAAIKLACKNFEGPHTRAPMYMPGHGGHEVGTCDLT